jgi:hypothetical protein
MWRVRPVVSSVHHALGLFTRRLTCGFRTAQGCWLLSLQGPIFAHERDAWIPWVFKTFVYLYLSIQVARHGYLCWTPAPCCSFFSFLFGYVEWNFSFCILVKTSWMLRRSAKKIPPKAFGKKKLVKTNLAHNANIDFASPNVWWWFHYPHLQAPSAFLACSPPLATHHHVFLQANWLGDVMLDIHNAILDIHNASLASLVSFSSLPSSCMLLAH